MFDGLFQSIPPTVAVGLLVLIICLNTFFALGKIAYDYFTKKQDHHRMAKIEEQLKNMTVTDSDTHRQVQVVIAHYESEMRFRKMLEDRVSKLENKVHGNGKPSLNTQLGVIKAELDIIKNEIDKLRRP